MHRALARMFVVLASLVSLFGSGVAASGQGTPPPFLERIIDQHQPAIRVDDRRWMSVSMQSMMHRAGVPFGFEDVEAFREYPRSDAPGPAASKMVAVKGLTVRQALDAIVAGDPRFAWRDLGGIVVMRPSDAWGDPSHPLQRRVPPVALDRVNAREAGSAIRLAIGEIGRHDKEVHSAPGKLFSVNFSGGSLFDLLNAIVSAHGELGWTVGATPSNLGDGMVRPLLFFYDPFGSGGAVNGALVPSRVVPPVTVVMTGAHAETVSRESSPIDRRLPVEVSELSADALPDVALRLGVPLGYEQAGALAPRASVRFAILGEVPDMSLPEGPSASVAGMTLREALNAIVAADERYEWREVDGVAVIRPVESWSDRTHPLEQLVAPVRLLEARVSEGFDVLARLLAPQGFRSTPFADEGRLSLQFEGGTLQAWLNAFVGVHGRLVWTLTSESAPVQLTASEAAMLAGPAVAVKGVWGGKYLPLGR